jgi:hypothetical protein
MKNLRKRAATVVEYAVLVVGVVGLAAIIIAAVTTFLNAQASDLNA